MGLGAHASKHPPATAATTLTFGPRNELLLLCQEERRAEAHAVSAITGGLSLRRRARNRPTIGLRHFGPPVTGAGTRYIQWIHPADRARLKNLNVIANIQEGWLRPARSTGRRVTTTSRTPRTALLGPRAPRACIHIGRYETRVVMTFFDGKRVAGQETP
jgi:hypothetical protein